jgi:hypothetical protein
MCRIYVVQKSGLTEAALQKRARLAGVVRIALCQLQRRLTSFHRTHKPFSNCFGRSFRSGARGRFSSQPDNEVCSNDGARRQGIKGLCI